MPAILAEEDHETWLSWAARHRIRSQIGRAYNQFARNCERLMSYAHGFESNSPHAAAAVASAVIAIGMAFDYRSKPPR